MMDLHPDDELLSALLDGEEATTAAHVAACDACQTRLDVLREVAEVVADPFEPEAAVGREHRIAMAIAAFRRGRVAPEGVPGHQSDDEQRAAIVLTPRRAGWATKGLPLVAAAAALVVVVAVVVRTSGNGETVGDAVGVPKDERSDAKRNNDGVAGNSSAANDTALPATLGSHDDVASLDRAVRAALPAAGSAPRPATGSIDGSAPDCSDAAAGRSSTSVSFLGTATLEGQPLSVYSYGTRSDPRWFAFSASPACDVVASG